MDRTIVIAILTLSLCVGCSTSTMPRSPNAVGAAAEWETIYKHIVKSENEIGSLHSALDVRYNQEDWQGLLAEDAVLRGSLQRFDELQDRDLISAETNLRLLKEYGLSARLAQFFANNIGGRKLARLVFEGKVRPTLYWKAYPNAVEGRRDIIVVVEAVESRDINPRANQ